MIFFERKIFIEFLDRITVRMTTPLRQNIFEINKIDEDKIIDLIDLKIVPSRDSEHIRFFAAIHYSEDVTDEFELEIFANRDQLIESISFEHGSKLIKTKILE